MPFHPENSAPIIFAILAIISVDISPTKRTESFSVLLRDSHLIGSGEVVAAKELFETLELGSAQAVRLLPKV
jgi:hypothetical protein